MGEFLTVPPRVVLQNLDSTETKAAYLGCTLLGVPVRTESQITLDYLDGSALPPMPVGSVEYVRSYMARFGIPEPASVTYHPAIRDRIRRSIQVRRLRDTQPGGFIKPMQTKTFTGFVRGRVLPPELEGLGASLVYESEPVSFKSEWRYYCQGPNVMGQARYDEGSEESEQPNSECIQVLANRVFARGGLNAFTLDVGVRSDGVTDLVEVNDAWAIGLYSGALTPKEYVQFLWSRWSDFVQF